MSCHLLWNRTRDGGAIGGAIQTIDNRGWMSARDKTSDGGVRIRGTCVFVIPRLSPHSGGRATRSKTTTHLGSGSGGAAEVYHNWQCGEAMHSAAVEATM